MTNVQEAHDPSTTGAAQNQPSTGGARLSLVLPMLVLVTVTIAGLAHQGVPVADSALYSAYFAVVILLPGWIVWRWIIGRYQAANPGVSHRYTGIEGLVCGACAGLVIELPSYVAARALGYPMAYVLGPFCVAAVLAISNRFSDRAMRDRLARLPTRSAGVSWTFSAIASYLSVWLAATVFSRDPLASDRLVDPDEMFHLALIGELRHHFPATYPYVEYSGGLTYQWFVHAHMAASSWVTGLDPELIYLRFDPLFLALLATAGAGVVAIRVSQHLWAGPLAAAVLVLVGSFDVTGSSIGEATPEERFLQGSILVHSPTQTYAFVLAIPVIVLCLELVRDRTVLPRSSWVALLIGMAALSGAKVTFLPIFACGFVSALLVELYRRRRLGGPQMLGVLSAMAVMVLSGWLLYGGNSQTLGLAPLQSTKYFMSVLGLKGGGLLGELVVTLSLLSMWLLPGAGAIGLLWNSRTRWDGRTWWLFGASAAGYGATFLLGHVGNSQVYFGRSSALLVAIASGWGLITVLPRRTTWRRNATTLSVGISAGFLLLGVRYLTERWREPAPVDGQMVNNPVLRLWINLPVILIVCVLVVLVRMLVRDISKDRAHVPAYVLLVFLVGLGSARTLAFVLGQRAEPGSPNAKFEYGMDGRRSAEWLKAHSSPDDRVLTNVHCGPAKPGKSTKCDARHFWMSALAERRFVVEGWAYTARSGDWTNDFWGSADMLRHNDALFTAPTASAWQAFLNAHNAQWALVDDRAPLNEPQLLKMTGLKRVYVDGHFSIWRVDGSF